MGIKGLHKQLSHVSRPRTQVAHCCGIARYEKHMKGKSRIRVAVDVSAWINKAIFGYGGQTINVDNLTNYGRACAADNGESEEELKEIKEAAFVEKCVEFVIGKLVGLRDESGVKVLVVLDGASPPIKAKETLIRRRRMEEARAVERNINKDPLDRVAAARRSGCGKEVFKRITSTLIQTMRKEGFSFLVAPYEADGQLAYMSRNNLIDLVITEDSDLIGYGALNCMFKLNDEQEGTLVRKRDLGASSSSKLDLLDFSDAMIATMCVAAGCDYCENLKNVGIISARDIVYNAFLGTNHFGRTKAFSPLERTFDGLFSKTSLNLIHSEKENYKRSFLHALLMFQYSVVFDPISGKCTFSRDPLTDIDRDLAKYNPYLELCKDKEELENILGEFHGATKARNIAEGWIDPRSNNLRHDEDTTPSHVLRAFREERKALDDFRRRLRNGGHVESDEVECQPAEIDDRAKENSAPINLLSQESSRMHTQAPLMTLPPLTQNSISSASVRSKLSQLSSQFSCTSPELLTPGQNSPMKRRKVSSSKSKCGSYSSDAGDFPHTQMNPVTNNIKFSQSSSSSSSQHSPCAKSMAELIQRLSAKGVSQGSKNHRKTH